MLGRLPIKYNMMYNYYYGSIYLQSVTHLAENQHVPDPAALPVGCQLLLYLFWGGKEKERCHFSHSAFHGEKQKLAVPQETHTNTRAQENSESSLHSGQLKLIPASQHEPFSPQHYYYPKRERLALTKDVIEGGVLMVL